MKKICVKNIKEDVLERAKITREMGVLKLTILFLPAKQGKSQF